MSSSIQPLRPWSSPIISILLLSSWMATLLPLQGYGETNQASLPLWEAKDLSRNHEQDPVATGTRWSGTVIRLRTRILGTRQDDPGGIHHVGTASTGHKTRIHWSSQTNSQVSFLQRGDAIVIQGRISLDPAHPGSLTLAESTLLERQSPEAIPMANEAWASLLADLKSQDEATYLEANRQLAKLRDPNRLGALKALLQSDDFLVRESAAEALCRMAGPEVIPSLLAALHQGSREGHDNDGLGSVILDRVWGDEQRCAQWVIAGFQANPASPDLEQFLWLAGFLEEDISHTLLIPFLEHAAPSIRATTAGALGGHVGVPNLWSRLLPLLSYPDEQVRASTLSTLGALQDIRALSHLEKACEDPSERIRLLARSALQRLLRETGQ